MKDNALHLLLLLALLLSSCGAAPGIGVEWQPPLLPIKLVFSDQGIRLELEVGVDIPYIGRVSVVAPLVELETEYPSLLVHLDEEVYQYDLRPQSNRKFEGIICETSCEINLEIARNGNIILDVRSHGSAKKASLIPNASNFQYELVVVGSYQLNIRRGPGADFNEIGGCRRGDILRTDGTTRQAKDGGTWYRVLVPPGNYGSGQEGWVNAKYVRPR